MSKDRTWLLISKKLSGEIMPNEQQELEELLRSDPDMHYALQNLTDLWNLPVQPTNEITDAFDHHISRMQQAGVPWHQDNETELNVIYPAGARFNPRKKIAFIGMAAMVLLIAGTGWYYARVNRARSNRPVVAQRPSQKKEIVTHNGYRQKITLPDGSIVWLNASSTLTYDNNFGNPIREVTLSGEAFFDVVSRTRSVMGKEQKIPFVIHTPQIDVRVLGTAFNVKSYPGDRQTETSLVRGKVEIVIHNRSDEKIILHPNEKLVVANDQAIQQSSSSKPANAKNQPIVSLSKLSYTGADSIVAETAWVQNKLVFDNESFAEVAAKMERWYNVQFEFSDQKTQQLRFTGVFENETLQQALDYMSITAPFHYSLTASKVVISR